MQGDVETAMQPGRLRRARDGVSVLPRPRRTRSGWGRRHHRPGIARLRANHYVASTQQPASSCQSRPARRRVSACDQIGRLHPAARSGAGGIPALLAVGGYGAWFSEAGRPGDRRLMICSWSLNRKCYLICPIRRSFCTSCAPQGRNLCLLQALHRRGGRAFLPRLARTHRSEMMDELVP